MLVSAGLAVASLMTSGCGKGSQKKPTELWGACSDDELTCASGQGTCLFWAGKQTCMPRCGENDRCPAGSWPTTANGDDCACMPGANPNRVHIRTSE